MHVYNIKFYLIYLKHLQTDTGKKGDIGLLNSCIWLPTTPSVHKRLKEGVGVGGVGGPEPVLRWCGGGGGGAGAGGGCLHLRLSSVCCCMADIMKCISYCITLNMLLIDNLLIKSTNCSSSSESC